MTRGWNGTFPNRNHDSARRARRRRGFIFLHGPTPNLIDEKVIRDAFDAIAGTVRHTER
jgi:hypothetical protein